MIRALMRRLLRTPPPPPVSDEEMEEMQRSSEEGLAEDRARDPEVREIAARLLRQREENHLGPMIWAALRGEPDA